ncbi:MAG: endopeptidase La [Clostridia bacterium]|nr:endopeptidase La [Clostridia bacterium]
MSENKVLETNNTLQQHPLIASRGVVAFPHNNLSFDVVRSFSIRAVEIAAKRDGLLILASQKDFTIEDPAPSDIEGMGTLVKISQVIKIHDNVVRVVCRGVARCDLLRVEKKQEIMAGVIFPIAEIEASAETAEREALLRSLKEAFGRYATMAPKMDEEKAPSIFMEQDLGRCADMIAAHGFFEPDAKQQILEQLDPVKRCEQLLKIISRENEVLKMEQEIHARVRESIEANQRDYYLHEQMRVIQDELGEGEGDDIDGYYDRVNRLNTTQEIKEKLIKEVDRMAKMPPLSHEGAVIRSYLDLVLEVPFGIYTEENLDIASARAVLEKDHYGMEEVKTRVLEFLAVRSLNAVGGQILCLVGPPGVGKTSIARSVAEATNRKLARVSLGGVHDEAEIRGHRKTYIGAMPGRIADAVIKAGSANPLILLDEVDKMCSDLRGDPASALLEVLDSEQNCNYVDHYIEVPMDLSQAFFIMTANSLDTIPRPLLDRMEVIELSSYLDEEKFHIAKQYLIPKQRKTHGLKGNQIRISDAALRALIDGYTRESGVRELERCIGKIMRKAALRIVEEGKSGMSVGEKHLEGLLGARKYKEEALYGADCCGIVNGLAWTAVGGEMLTVEVSALEGNGKLELTGSLGDVMKESARTALSYLRSVSDRMGVSYDFYKTMDLHIHFPEGAVPKDGPSAGITIATAVCSALTGIPADNKTAMTGEITLTGRVLPIGGLREKTMAAYKHGIKRVYIPKENLPDLEKVDPTVRKGIEFIAVSHADEVLKGVLGISDKKKKTFICPPQKSGKKDAGNEVWV